MKDFIWYHYLGIFLSYKFSGYKENGCQKGKILPSRNIYLLIVLRWKVLCVLFSIQTCIHWLLRKREQELRADYQFVNKTNHQSKRTVYVTSLLTSSIFMDGYVNQHYGKWFTCIYIENHNNLVVMYVCLRCANLSLSNIYLFLLQVFPSKAPNRLWKLKYCSQCIFFHYRKLLLWRCCFSSRSCVEANCLSTQPRFCVQLKVS